MSNHDDTRMEDTNEQEQNEVGSLIINADEPHRHPHDSHHQQQGHDPHPGQHHGHNHHDDHGLRRKQKKRDKRRVKMLDQLTKSLANTTVTESSDNNEVSNHRPRNGARKIKKRIKTRREKKEFMHMAKAIGNTSLNEKTEAQSQNTTTRNTGSTTNALHIVFDISYVKQAETGMNNDQIKDWLESVYLLHIDRWRQDCLHAPGNQPSLKAAWQDPMRFAKSVLAQAMTRYKWSKTTGKMITNKSTADFAQGTATTACLIARDSKRSGEYATCEDERKLHHAAVMLLVTFVRAEVPGALRGTMVSVTQGRGDGKIPKAERVPMVILDAVSGDSEELQRLVAAEPMSDKRSRRALHARAI